MHGLIAALVPIIVIVVVALIILVLNDRFAPDASLKKIVAYVVYAVYACVLIALIVKLLPLLGFGWVRPRRCACTCDRRPHGPGNCNGVRPGPGRPCSAPLPLWLGTSHAPPFLAILAVAAISRPRCCRLSPRTSNIVISPVSGSSIS